MQLPEIFRPLPFKEVPVRSYNSEKYYPLVLKEYQKRVLFLDTQIIYDRISADSLHPYHKISHFKRIQSVPIYVMFPNEKGFCGCGCGAALTGQRKRWATDDCMHFAQGVWSIINGYPNMIQSYMNIYYADECVRCKCNSSEKDFDIDHIIPVKNGGGGCWLSNFQYLCNPCHKIKTIEDFNWKKKIIIPEHPKLF